MQLSERQKRHLRGLAHRLKVCVHVGSSGVTPRLIAELGAALRRHELLKVKVRADNRNGRESVIAALLEKTGALLVSRVGNVAVLYRHNPEKAVIEMPPARPPATLRPPQT